jgi:hypothetical protein
MFLWTPDGRVFAYGEKRGNTHMIYDYANKKWQQFDAALVAQLLREDPKKKKERKPAPVAAADAPVVEEDPAYEPEDEVEEQKGAPKKKKRGGVKKGSVTGKKLTSMSRAEYEDFLRKHFNENKGVHAKYHGRLKVRLWNPKHKAAADRARKFSW